MNTIRNEPPSLGKKPALILYGGGGHGKCLLDLVHTLGSYDLLGIIDDFLPEGHKILGVPVLGDSQKLKVLIDQGVQLAVNGIGGIGNVDARIKAFDTLLQAGFKCPTIIHPSAWVESSAVLEEGCQVLSLAFIGSDARIGFGSVINAGVCISHDTRAGKITNFSPHAALAGNVIVEDYAQIGMSVTLNMGVRIGERAIIGNGATIKKDVPSHTRVRAGTIWPLPQGNHPYALLNNQSAEDTEV